MAFVHGKNAYINISDSGATARNLSAFCDSVSGLPGARDLSEVTAFGDGGTKNIPGLANISFTIAGHFEPTATTGPHAVLNGLRTSTVATAFVYAPQGNTTGNVQMSGVCWLSSYEVSAAVADKISFSAEFQVDGTVTVGLVP